VKLAASVASASFLPATRVKMAMTATKAKMAVWVASAESASFLQGTKAKLAVWVASVESASSELPHSPQNWRQRTCFLRDPDSGR
jgi:hypothetical protein